MSPIRTLLKLDGPKAQKGLVLSLICLIFLLDALLFSAAVHLAPMYIKIEKNSTKDNGDLSYFFIARTLIQILVSPVSGMVIDHYGCKTPLLAGLFASCFSAGVFAIAKNYWSLLLARALQGLASAFANTAGWAMLADRYSKKSRQVAMATALAFLSAGYLVAPSIGHYCNQMTSFLILAGIFVAILIVSAGLIEPDERVDLPTDNIQRLFTEQNILIMSLCLVLAALPCAFIEPSLRQWDKLPSLATQQELGVMWTITFIPHLIALAFATVLCTRMPSNYWFVALWGLVTESVACCLLPLAANMYALQILLCLLSFGLALFLASVLPMFAHLVDVCAARVYGGVYALAMMAWCLPYVLGPMVANQLVVKFGFATVCVAIAGLLIICSQLLCLLRK